MLVQRVLNRPRMPRTGPAVGACAALVLMSACGGDGGPAADAVSSPGLTVEAAAGPHVATGRVLAAIAVQHLQPQQAQSLEGFGSPDGATSTIKLRFGPGDRLYVSSLSPEYLPDIASCSEARQAMADNYEMKMCEEIPGGVLQVLGSPPGSDHAILGYRIDGTGQVAAWIETSDDDASRNLVTDVLRDPRLGYEVDAATFNEAADLTNYKDVEVTIDLHPTR